MWSSAVSNSSAPMPVQVLLFVSDMMILFIAAATTYFFTKRYEQQKYQRIRDVAYKREVMLKEKTAAVRKAAGEPPSGKLLEDVYIDKIYLWEVEDLRKRFPSDRQIENLIKSRPIYRAADHSVPSPFFKTPSNVSDASGEEFPSDPASAVNDKGTSTLYNKLITNHECILADIIRKPNMPTHSVAFIRAGPRRHLHFDPANVSAAIVTCGGLCPGLNNVIRELTKSLHYIYGIGGTVYGIRGGYHGFYDPKLTPIPLTPDLIENVHHTGGTVLGSSRGGFDLKKIIHFIKTHKVNQLYVIGGDGTHRGAFRVHEGCMEEGLNVAVAGIPKTIDNDVDYIDYSFGFRSAVEAAQVAIRTAKTEAQCNLPNGIGIVKLMGRSAGFIAAHATMASGDVDLCLVPEVPIVLDGKKGCLPHLMRRVKNQGYAVVVVAEGAGEDILGTSVEKDASGNKKLPPIGEFMKKRIEEYFDAHGDTATVKYIDPSYTVRSVAANAADSLYCMQLAQNAVHGAMAGFTGFTVGLSNNRMVFLPIPELVSTSPRSMNPHGRSWERVLALTGQPNTVPPLKEGEKGYDSHAPMLR